MSIYEDLPSPLSAEVSLEVPDVAVQSLMTINVDLAANLGIMTKVYNNLVYAVKYVGEESAPQDIKRLRRQVHDMMRRLGQPVIVKKMLTIDDVEKGLAERSPNYSSIYGQTRNNDNLSFGSGFVSTEKSEDEWINPTTGDIIQSDFDVDSSWVKAPKYRGFGPSIITYLIEPDAPQDFFTLTPTGAMIQVQTADVTMGWYPKVNDGDLIINVELDDYGHVIDAGPRYQAKTTAPVSIRGLDRRGRKNTGDEFGNRHVVNQTFSITRIPENHELMKVEIDR